jgi:hypothetical protein
MLEQKTPFGSIHKTLKGNLHHNTYFKEFASLMKKEEEIVMELVNMGYIITNKEISYVGGGVFNGVDTYLNYDTGKYQIDKYTYVEHGVWKLKFKIKPNK